jgi:hypothetical protein
MAKKRRQLSWRTGSTYTLRESGNRERLVKLIGHGKLSGKEILIFQPKKKARKRR